MRSPFILTIALSAHFCLAFAADKISDQPSSAAQVSKSTPVILIAPPVNASVEQNIKDMWFAGISEQLMRFRLSASDKINIVSPDRQESGSDIQSLAARFHATYIIQQNFEVSHDGKTVSSLIEVVPVDMSIDAQSFDQDIAVGNLSEELDKAALWIFSTIGLAQDENLKRFFAIPAIPVPHKDLRELGAAALQCRNASGQDMPELARQVMTIVDKDSRNLLAQYIVAQAYEHAGDNEKASTVLNDILVVIPNHTALYIDICRNLRLCGKNSDVLKYAAATENKAIKSNALLLEGALAFEALGRQQKARRVFEAIIEQDPNQPDALLFFAREYSREGNPGEALRLAQKVVAADDRNGPAYFILGNSLAVLGKKTEAVTALEKCVSQAPEEAAAGRLLADLYMENGLYEKAARHYALILKLNAKFYAGHIKTAEALEMAGDKKEAVNVLVRAERLFPDSLDLQRRIGLLEYTLGNTSNATLHLERFINKRRSDPAVFMALGDIYTRAKKYDNALAMFADAMPLGKDRLPCMFARSSVYMEKHDYKAAISELLDILKQDPSYPNVHRMMADAWFALGTSTEALACYKKARTLGGDNITAQQRIAELTFAAGDISAAETEYLLHAKLDPKNAGAHYRLAILSLKQNRETQADEFLATAVSLGNAGEEIWFALGNGFDSVNNAVKAINAYNACLALNSHNQHALALVIEAYLKADRKSDAAEACLRLYELDNNRNSGCLARAGLLSEEVNAIARAYDLYKKYVAGGHVNADVNLHLARMEFDRKSFGSVINLLAHLDKKYLGDPSTVRMLGESYFRTGQHGNALSWLESAAISAANDTAVVEMLAVSYESVKQYEKARVSFANLVSLSTDNRKAGLAFHIGELYEKENRTDNALTRYRENVVRYPDEMRNYERAITIMMERNDLSAGREMLELAIARPSAKAAMQKTLAEVCSRLNDKTAAIRHYEQYLEHNQNDFNSWFNLGDLYFSKNAFAKAVEALSKAAALKENDFPAHSMLSVALKKTGNMEGAIAAAKQAHALQPDNSDVLALLAECFRTTRNRDELITALTKLCAIRPGDFDSRSELGKLLLASGKTAEGAAVLENACTMRPKDSSIRIIIANAYELLKKQEARFAHLRDAVAVNESDIEAQYELGRYYAETGNAKKAEKQFLTALAINADHAACLYQYGRLLKTQGYTDKAFELLRRAVKVDSYTAPSKVLYARLAWELKNTDLALETIESALFIDSSSVEAMSLAGNIYQSTGKPDMAKSICSRAISLDTTCADCYRTLASIAFEECDYSPAIGYFRRSLDIGGYNEQTAVLLGRAYKLACQDDKAQTLFEEILVKNPVQYEAFYQLVDLYIRSDRVEKARQLAAKARRDEKTVWHHLAAGEIFEIDGDTDAAQISFSVALRLMPDIADAHSGLGRIDLLKGDFTSAIVNFGKALARDPYNPYLMLDMAQAYEGTGENQSAFEIYQEVSGKYPQVAEAYYRFALLNSRLKEHLRAVEIIKQGLEHNPKNSRLLMGLGHALRMAGRPEEAVGAYQQAVKRDERQYMDAYLYIANIYSQQLANEEEAQKYFRKYLKAGGEQDNIKKQMAVLE